MTNQPLSDRLDDLEIRFSYQQETIDSLNETVTKQWETLEQLRLHIERLEGRMRDMADLSAEPGNEPPPPHY